MKKIQEDGSPLAPLRDFLLHASSHEKFKLRLKSGETYGCERPSFTALALNVPETYIRVLSLESMTDGLAQRWLHVYCGDNLAPMKARWDIPKIKAALAEPLRAMFAQNIAGKTFSVSAEAGDLYESEFDRLNRDCFGGRLSRSYYKRGMFSAYKYALLFRLIFQKGGDEIDAEDMAAGLRMAEFHLHSIMEILTIKSGNKKDTVHRVARILRRAREIRAEAHRDGKKFSGFLLTRKINALPGKVASRVAEVVSAEPLLVLPKPHGVRQPRNRRMRRAIYRKAA